MRDNLPGILTFIPLWLLFTAWCLRLAPEAGLFAATVTGWIFAVLLTPPDRVHLRAAGAGNTRHF